MPERVPLRGAIERVDRALGDGYGGRFYRWKGHNYWSVTTILDVLPKQALFNWGKKMTADYAVRNLERLIEMRDADGVEETIDWVKRAPDRSRDRAGNLGTSVHEAAEAYVLGQPYPEWSDEQRPFFENAFLPFLAEWQPTYVAVEAPVFSNDAWYAGTLDAIIELDGVRILIDYKTTKSGVWPDNALQLAAYRFAESFIGLPDGDDEPMPSVAGAAVLLLRPEGYKLQPVRVDRTVYDVFLYAREIFRWEKETRTTVVARPAKPDAGARRCATCSHHVLSHGPLRCHLDNDAGEPCACDGFLPERFERTLEAVPDGNP